MTISLLAKPGFNCTLIQGPKYMQTGVFNCVFCVVIFAAVTLMLTLQLYSVYVKSIQRGQFLVHLL